MGKRVLIFGPPGVGKGTHSKRLSADLGVPHVAMGEMFREAIAHKTDLGQRAATHIQRGELVPDDLVVAVLERRISEPDAQNGFLLDGFPRTVPQAQTLGRRMSERKEPIDCVLSLEAPEDVLVARLAGRSTCSGCQATYSGVEGSPRVAGVCNACGGTLEQRPDDREDAVRRRLSEYRAKTAPVLDFFRRSGWPVLEVFSVGPVDEVYGRIHGAAMGGAA